MRKELEVEQVALDSIDEIDSVYWFGDSGDSATVRSVAVQFDVDPEPDHRDCDPAELPYDR